MSVTKTIKMICTNVNSNNNKFWNAELHDNGDWFVTYGRVGYSGVKEGPYSGGEKTLNKKIAEKKKKGYTEFNGIDASGQKTEVSSVQNLKEVAIKQIQYSSPQLQMLIERLVKSNIHTILSSTKITYDAKSGLFSTPLGIITIDMINEARNILALLKDSMDDNLLAKYLMLVPHDFGMKKVSYFKDTIDFSKELNILDSLEASYQQISKSPSDSDKKEEKTEEKVFEVKLDLLPSSEPDYKAIEEWFETSKKNVHGYNHVKVRNIYKVSISTMDEAFEKEGSKLGAIERVFHGTSEANLLSILKSGLKVSPPSTAFIAGKMFGNGVYGAKESTKALGYTFGRWGGSSSNSGWLFVCNFAMGKTYDPTRSGSPPTGYDSTWARAKKCGLMHDELIVYSNKQIQITHLMECY